MDSAVENLKKTSDIKRKTTLNKLHNMYWLKNTSHSANPEKIKSVVYKQKQEQDEDNKVEDKLSLTETINASLVEEPDKYSSIDNTCKKYLSNDTMPENDKNMGNKDTDTANLFLNADKLVSQKDEEEKDMLSIVESIVTAKLEAEFCTNKKHKDQSSTLESNAINVTQDAVCTNVSDLQKPDGDTEELKLIKQSDGNNNNNSKPTIPYISKINNKPKQTCKTTGIESSKASIETKDKDVHIKTNTITKTSIKAGNNTNVTKDNEKSSTPNSDSKKAISNSSKSFSPIDKNARVDQFTNKHNARSTACIRKQEFVKQHNVSRSGIEKETKNVTAKSNLVKTGFETTNTTYQSKNINKDKPLQKQQQTMSKQFASKLKGQEFLRKNASPLNLSIDKNKIEKATHISEKTDSPLNERKSEKNVNEKNFQSDQKMNCAVNPRKNTTFVTQYKNSTFSKPTQNIPKDTGHTPTYRRNPSYACNNPKFDKERNGSAERRVTKKEHTPINTFTKSNTRIEESKTNNLENCTKQKKEIIYVQPKNVKSTCVHEVDTLVFNDTNDINPVNVETDLIENKESMKLNVNYIHTEQRPAMSEQSCEKTNDISKVDTDQQHREMNNEKINSFKHLYNLTSDKYITDSQANVTHHHSLKSDNMQHTNDVKSSQTIWSDQSSDNAMHKGATVVGLQQSIQQHFNTEQPFIQAGNPTRQISPWEQNNKFYDPHFSANDRMQQLSQIPNTFSATPYECNVQMSNDSNVTAASMLETTMNSNRENSNVPYRCVPNIQQRPVMALSDFPSHHVSSCQTNQARWNSSIQDGFHIDYPYVATQPATMHMYNPGAIGPDDFNNTHTMDYVSHPIVYAASPYMQTWNPQLQYSLPIFYNTPCTNYTAFPHTNQTNNFNNAIYDQQHKHIPGAQVNNYVRDTYNDMNTCVVQSRNVADNVPIKSNYYCKKYQDNCRAVYDVPQYVAPVSHSRPQQGMNFMPTTGINQYNASYCPSNQKYKQNTANYMKNPKSQIIQDFACDDNGSEDIPPIISPKEFVTNNVNLSNKSDQFATHMFKSEFKTKSNMGYRPPSSLPRYNGGFRTNTTFQDFPKEYIYPISIGRGTYKTKKT